MREASDTLICIYRSVRISAADMARVRPFLPLARTPAYYDAFITRYRIHDDADEVLRCRSGSCFCGQAAAATIRRAAKISQLFIDFSHYRAQRDRR